MNEEKSQYSGLITASMVIAIILCIPLVNFVNYIFGCLDIALIILTILVLNKKTTIPKVGPILMLCSSGLNIIVLLTSYIFLSNIIKEISENGHYTGHDLSFGGTPMLIIKFLAFVLRISAIIIYSIYRNDPHREAK
ncbi:hypothetical protein DY102_03645 [Apilactobacillus timberlakei]|uniref:hypothetical protein n=1 Tax=Apilactobacillus timberlakei TaxID=2008380 RepID=UPI001129E92C|nr:hypothetical protein [Apilactobacillus timberlakei]TPR23144.1 hypothetical protein DY102_03645 [Apilactobacillus timberlakei]